MMRRFDCDSAKDEGVSTYHSNNRRRPQPVRRPSRGLKPYSSGAEDTIDLWSEASRRDYLTYGFTIGIFFGLVQLFAVDVVGLLPTIHFAMMFNGIYSAFLMRSREGGANIAYSTIGYWMGISIGLMFSF